MTDKLHLHCDGVIGLGGQAPAPCSRQFISYDNAAGRVRKEARADNWKTRRQTIIQPFVREDGTKGERRWTIPRDFCPSHADQAKVRTPDYLAPVRDYRANA